MRVKLLNDSYPKTYAVVLGTSDEVLASVQAFAELHRVAACQATVAIPPLRSSSLRVRLAVHRTTVAEPDHA